MRRIPPWRVVIGGLRCAHPPYACCPITSRVRPFGLSVVLPPGLPVAGEILTGHVRSIDRRARPIVFAGRVPDPVLEEVRGKLAALLGMRFLGG